MKKPPVPVAPISKGEVLSWKKISSEGFDFLAERRDESIGYGVYTVER